MQDEPDWDVGSRLREERTRLGLSQARLSDLTGLSKAYLVKLESKTTDTNPSLDVLRRLADALETTVADLIGAPPLRLVADEVPIPPSLKAFAEESGLTRSEVEMLASIRWRSAEQPRTRERWRYIYDSLKASRQFDDDDE